MGTVWAQFGTSMTNHSLGDTQFGTSMTNWAQFGTSMTHSLCTHTVWDIHDKSRIAGYQLVGARLQTSNGCPDLYPTNNGCPDLSIMDVPIFLHRCRDTAQEDGACLIS